MVVGWKMRLGLLALASLVIGYFWHPRPTVVAYFTPNSIEEDAPVSEVTGVMEKPATVEER